MRKEINLIQASTRYQDIVGDTVEIEFSPYDLTRGRIAKRR